MIRQEASAMLHTVDQARDDVSAASAGGAPFLICFGATLLACAVASVYVPRGTAALLVMFQGVLALPGAFWLERRMSWKSMAPDNPLRSLSIQLAMSQIVALPVVLVVYSLNPGGVPLAMAAIAGGHFLPYAWLHRTKVYVVLGVVVSVGGLAVQMALGSTAFPFVLALMTTSYWVAAPLVYRNAARHGMPASNAAAAPGVSASEGGSLSRRREA